MPKGFLEAVKTGRLEEVEALYNIASSQEKKILLSMPDVSGFTAIHLAALHGQTFIFQWLLSIGANLTTKVSRDQFTPLHLAAIADRDEIIQIICKQAETTLEEVNGDNLTALDIALEKGQDNLKAVRVLVANGAIIKEPKKMYPTFLYAVEQDDLAFVRAVHTAGYRPLYVIKNTTGLNVLIERAIQCLSVNVLKYLAEELRLPLQPVSQEARETLTDFEQDFFKEDVLTPFHLLAKAMPVRTVFYLPYAFKQSGLDQGETFSSAKVKDLMGELGTYGSLRVFMPYNGTTAQLQSISIEEGLILNYSSEGIVEGVEIKLEKLQLTIQYLQSFGFNINQRDAEGHSPGHYLLSCPVDILRVFVACGLFLTCDDLQTAIEVSDDEMILYVASLGIDLNQTTSDGTDFISSLLSTPNSHIRDKGELLTQFHRLRAETVEDSVGVVGVEMVEGKTSPSPSGRKPRL